MTTFKESRLRLLLTPCSTRLRKSGGSSGTRNSVRLFRPKIDRLVWARELRELRELPVFELVRGKRGRNTSKRLIVKSVSLSVMLGPEESTRRLSYRLRSELPILSWPKTYR